MRILTLLVRYGTDKYRDAEARMHELIDQTLSGVERQTIVIDNALPPDIVECTSSTRTLIGGDNTHWEFSGWDKAVRVIGSQIWSYDYVHFVTSAFEELYTAYLQRFSTKMLAALPAPAAVGHIDCLNGPVTILGYVSQHWIRSSYFFLRPIEVKTLGSMVSVREARLFSGDPARPFLPNAPVDSAFQASVIGWLTGTGTGQGVAWHSRFDLNDATLSYFERKTLAILNEHLLSARLRALGCRVVDATWLATVLARHGDDPLQICLWRDQLRNRDQDSIILPNA